MRLELRYPATVESAPGHAALAVELFRSEFDAELDFAPVSLELVDGQIERMREEGFAAEDVGEALFALGCYLGEVMVRALDARWLATAGTPLAGLSPWPVVVRLASGATWDPIGKVFRRFELGESEYLPAFFANASGRLG